MTWQIYLRLFIPLLVAIDPIGVVPVFLSITSNLSEQRRRTVSFQAVAVAFVISLGFMFLGEWLFRALSVTVTDFKIAGGVLLLVLAILDLLTTGKPAVDERTSVGVVPLALPLIAGPATLTTSLLLARTYGYAPVTSALAVNFLLLLGVLRCAHLLARLAGVNAMTALSKLVMLLLAAIAVNFIRLGVTDAVLEITRHAAAAH